MLSECQSDLLNVQSFWRAQLLSEKEENDLFWRKVLLGVAVMEKKPQELKDKEINTPLSIKNFIFPTASLLKPSSYVLIQTEEIEQLSGVKIPFFSFPTFHHLKVKTQASPRVNISVWYKNWNLILSQEDLLKDFFLGGEGLCFVSL